MARIIHQQRDRNVAILGLDRDKSEQLLRGLKERLFDLEGHQDTVLIEYILVLLSSGKGIVKIKEELETFMSSTANADRLVKWLFEIYTRLKSASYQKSSESSLPQSIPEEKRPLKSVVMAAGASVSKTTAYRSAKSILQSVVDHAVKSNNASNNHTICDAREIINKKRRHTSNCDPAPLVAHNDRSSSTREERENMMNFSSNGTRNCHLDKVPDVSLSANDSSKKLTKCADFPNCPLSDEKCPLVHPKETCKYFPNCLYGRDCLYIHPPVPCRFGNRCSNQFCNFTHSEQTHTTTTAAATIATTSSETANGQAPVLVPLSIPCKFNERCRRPDCPFLHTLSFPCPQGAQCMRPACPFTHPQDHAAPTARSLVNRPCRFGRTCAKADCPFQHPDKAATPNVAASLNKD